MPSKKSAQKPTTIEVTDTTGSSSSAAEAVEVSLEPDVIEPGEAVVPSLPVQLDLPVGEEQKQIAIMSWTLTKMRYNFTLMEKNLFLKVIEVGQKFINKEYLGKNYDLQMIQTSLGDVPRIEFPIKDVLQKGKNYQWVKDSLRTLNMKTFGIPAEDNWDFKDVNLFQSIEASEKKGLMRVELTHYFWEAFFKLKVFKMIDTNVAYKFKSVYTERIYELLVGNKVAVTYDLINLRKMFALEEKYKNNNLFITNVVASSQKEMKNLDICPFYFDYKLIYDGRRIDKVTFIVIEKNDSGFMSEVLKSIGDGGELDPRVVACVKRNFPRTVVREDVESRLKLVQKRLGVNGLVSKIDEIWEAANKLKEEKKLKVSASAYFVGALKRLAEAPSDDKVVTASTKQVNTPIVDKADDGYTYYTKDQLEEKAEMLGSTLAQIIDDLCIEQLEDGQFRAKIR